jgi:DNA-binding NarL/FixJ family response regulator
VAPVRVLIVDDEDLFLRAASAVVDEVDGFEVVGSVGSGEESISAAEKLRPDLVLMDVNLPGMDGLESTRRLRARAVSAVVLLLSTLDEDEFDGDVEACGAAGYLTKSAFGPDTLAAAWAAASL